MVWTLSEPAHVPLTFLSVFLPPAHTGPAVVPALGNAPVAAVVISDGQSQHPQLISFVKFWDFCGNEVDSRGMDWGRPSVLEDAIQSMGYPPHFTANSNSLSLSRYLKFFVSHKECEPSHVTTNSNSLSLSR